MKLHALMVTTGEPMKRIRLGTLLLLVTIVALGFGIMEQGRRAARREAELEAKLTEANAVVAEHYPLGIVNIQSGASVLKRAEEKDGR